MAFPVIVSVTESSVDTAGTTHLITLPTLVAGELVIIASCKGSTSASFNTLANWSELVDDAVANGITIWSHDATGSEGASVSFTSTASTRSASLVFRITGATPTTTQQPQLSSVITGTSTGPSSGLNTPTAGPKDFLWISVIGCAGEATDNDTLFTAPPVGGWLPTPPWQKTCGTVGTNLGGIIGAAWRNLYVVSDDPTGFTLTTSLAYRAYTISVHPAVNERRHWPPVAMYPRIPA